MKIRSHIMRPLDGNDPWNRVAVALSVAAGLIGAILTLVADREILLAIEAGGTTFLGWALVRELDPDRQESAVIAAVLAGAWVLTGQGSALLPLLGLMMVTRLIVETTGRRPLPNDLRAMVLLATAISFTPAGWVMGFGLAVALYVDDRMAEEHYRLTPVLALAAAVGSSVVVSLIGAMPDRLSAGTVPVLALLGGLAFVAVVREPVNPVSFVDSRSKRFLRLDRLHAARATAGILVFVAAVVSGGDAAAVVPMSLCLAVALGSSELERIQRSRR